MARLHYKIPFSEREITCYGCKESSFHIVIGKNIRKKEGLG